MAFSAKDHVKDVTSGPFFFGYNDFEEMATVTPFSYLQEIVDGAIDLGDRYRYEGHVPGMGTVVYSWCK